MIALTSDDVLLSFRFSSGGVLMPSRIDLTGLGVRVLHSSIGYAGCGRYEIEDCESDFCGRLGSGLDASSGGRRVMDGGTERR